MTNASNKHSLLMWMLEKKTFKTSDIIQWGLDSFSNRASRTAREYAQLGLIRRLTKFEKECRGIKNKEGIYIIDEKAIKDYLQPKLF